jgi:diadenosine tetraphosphate (Ap4A) HIT family hydrolase
VVQHVHFHIIPKPAGDQGLGIGWPAMRLDADAEVLAETIRAAMSRGS